MRNQSTTDLDPSAKGQGRFLPAKRGVGHCLIALAMLAAGCGSDDGRGSAGEATSVTLGDQPAPTGQDESDDRRRESEVSESDDAETEADLSTDDDDDATVGSDTVGDDADDEGEESESVSTASRGPGECSYFNHALFDELEQGLLAGTDEALRPVLYPTLLAIGEGDPDAVLAAWREKPDEFESSLAIAALIGCTEVMKPLIDNGAVLDATFEVDWNYGGQLGAAVGEGNSVSVLGTAFLSGNLEAVKLLLSSGANPNGVLLYADCSGWKPSFHVPPISIAFGMAISQENLEAVELLLNSGADPDGNSSHCFFPSLFRVVAIGWTEAVELLVGSGADPHWWAAGWNSLISVALEGGYRDGNATNHPLWDDTIWTVLLDYGITPTWREFANVLGWQEPVPAMAFSEVILAAGTGGLQRFDNLLELENAIERVRQSTSMLGADVAAELIDLLIETQQHLL